MKTTFILSLFMFSSLSLALTNATPALDTAFDSVAVVALDGKDDHGDIVPGYCVATFINPSVAVTAGHCLGPAIALGVRKSKLMLGHYNYITKPDGSKVRSGWKILFQQEMPADLFVLGSLKPGPNDDMGIIVFKSPVPHAPEVKFATTISQQEAQAVVPRISQYAPSVVTINLVEEMSTDFRRISLLNQISSSSSHFESQSVARVQPGDSGAPLFVRIGPTWKLAGVVKGRAETIFSNWDVISDLSKGLCTLAQKVPQHRADLCH